MYEARRAREESRNAQIDKATFHDLYHSWRGSRWNIRSVSRSEREHLSRDTSCKTRLIAVHHLEDTAYDVFRPASNALSVRSNCEEPAGRHQG
eukprot:7391029-Prymnesium_polylepis.4